MRSSGNFTPEWGYLAPAPSFLRTARVVLVATAVGATAGAGVVLALVDHPVPEGGEKVSVAAAHAIVTSVQAATPVTVPLASVAAPATAAIAAPVPSDHQASDQQTSAPSSAPSSVAPSTAALPNTALPSVTSPSVVPIIAPASASSQTQAVVAPPSAAGDTAEASKADAAKPASGMASLSDMPPNSEAVPAVAPDGTPVAPDATQPQKKTKHHSGNGWKLGPGIGTVLRRIFTAHSGTSYYPSR